MHIRFGLSIYYGRTQWAYQAHITVQHQQRRRQCRKGSQLYFYYKDSVYKGFEEKAF
jgi:hypothetical protein